MASLRSAPFYHEDMTSRQARKMISRLHTTTPNPWVLRKLQPDEEIAKFAGISPLIVLERSNRATTPLSGISYMYFPLSKLDDDVPARQIVKTAYIEFCPLFFQPPDGRQSAPSQVLLWSVFRDLSCPVATVETILLLRRTGAKCKHGEARSEIRSCSHCRIHANFSWK